jgi:lipopolysaccharide/colanic/teichoic acid biosynthesis glycosyltransferase
MFEKDPSSQIVKPSAARDATASHGRVILSGSAFILLGVMAWIVPPSLVSLPARTPRWAALAVTVCLLLILHAALTWSAQRSLALAFQNAAHHLPYRASVLLSVGIGWIRTLTLVSRPPIWQGILYFLLIAAGAVLGGFLSTTLTEGWVEQNYPPSAETKAWVKRQHQILLASKTRNPRSKRIFDITLAMIGLLISAPICAAISILIWFEDPGPILFIKNSVGLGGENFHQYKFRTMIRGAEFDTGPILARKNDSRVLLLGRFLRKTALDELPQLLNIFLGDMSFVGPRPQRTVLVHGYLETMPEFAERHAIRPGLAGLAQLVGSYHISPRQKLRFDRIYVRHAGLGFDLKLLLLSFLLVFWLRWRKDWDGHIPRTWLRFGRRSTRD